MSVGASSYRTADILGRLHPDGGAPVLVFEVDAGSTDDTDGGSRHCEVRLVGCLRDKRRPNGSARAVAPGDFSAVLVLRTLTSSRLLSFVRTLTSGKATLPQDALRIVDPQVADGSMRVGDRVLTHREWDVLRLLAEGDTTRDIAQRLSYSERTVKNVVHDMLEKLDCRTRAQAVAVAARQGVI